MDWLKKQRTLTKETLPCLQETSCLSKILVKIVENLLTAALDRQNIYDEFQSRFWKKHSTETALHMVSNDIVMSSYEGDCSVLVLVDLSSTFVSVEYRILIKRLCDWVCFSGIALDWIHLTSLIEVSPSVWETLCLIPPHCHVVS